MSLSRRLFLTSGAAAMATRLQAQEAVSMAETKCASWRGKSVPVWLREKGCMSPCELWRRAHRGLRRVA